MREGIALTYMDLFNRYKKFHKKPNLELVFKWGQTPFVQATKCPGLISLIGGSAFLHLSSILLQRG